MILTYKYRIKDNSARNVLRRHAFAVNQVWNYCVDHQRTFIARYRAGGPQRRWPSDLDLKKLTSGSSADLNIHSGTIYEICRQFCISRDAARCTPRFRRSQGPRRSLGWIPFRSGDFQRDRNSVTYLSRRYRLFGTDRRPLGFIVMNGAFAEDSRGRWYACLTVEVRDLPMGAGQIGVDLGLKTLATCSDGTKFPAPRHYQLYEAKLATAQRAGNKKRVRAIHAKIKNCRKDFTHKATSKIARDNALIAIGDINSSQLAKTRLAKSVRDAGWSMFRTQLRYKASRHRAVYLDVDERFTTQTCSQCGTLPPERPKGIAGLGIRAWDCSACGASHDRDVNAARNILAFALSAQRRGDESRPTARMGNRISTNVRRRDR